jgi:hypothetical protein
VAAHGADARARPSDLAAKQQQIDYLLNVGDGVPVLREPHSPADNRSIGAYENFGRSLHLVARDAALLDKLIPTHGLKRPLEFIKARGLLLYKSSV